MSSIRLEGCPDGQGKSKSRAPGFIGFTLVELAVLNRYRKRVI